jgi:hypothetical protein
MLSTSKQNQTAVVSRREGHERKDVEVPRAIARYNANMGGVDLADQRRSYYSIGRESKKWWRYLFWFGINVSLVNSYLLQKMSPGPQTKERAKMRMWEFYEKVADSLIGRFTNRKQPSRKRCPSAVAVDPIHKFARLLESRKKHCTVCSNKGRRTASNRFIETKFHCVKCGKAMCRGCFVEYHVEKDHHFLVDGQ